jgi:putative oxidoreductase
MYASVWSIDMVLLALRLFLGAMILAHGLNKVFRGGRIAGTARWFESIGMRPGRLNAVLAASSEIGAGIVLIFGLLTPLCAGALIALMSVAIVTVHRSNGFFIFNAGQGIEYCLAVIVAALVTATLGPGRLSLDYVVRRWPVWSWLNQPSHGLIAAIVVGFGSAGLQLLVTYRPPRKAV